MTLPLFLVAPRAGRGCRSWRVARARRAGGSSRGHRAPDQPRRAGDARRRARAAGHLRGASTRPRPSCALRVVEVVHEPEPEPRFVLVQALAKGDRDDQAVEAATELGVDEIVPWQAARCIVQWRGDRGEKARRKWETTVGAATKQSRRARVPVVAPLATTSTLVARVQAAAAAYVLHEDATSSSGRAGAAGRRRRARAWSAPRAVSRPRRWPSSRPPAPWPCGWGTACCARPAPARPRSPC